MPEMCLKKKWISGLRKKENSKIIFKIKTTLKYKVCININKNKNTTNSDNTQITYTNTNNNKVIVILGLLQYIFFINKLISALSGKTPHLS